MTASGITLKHRTSSKLHSQESTDLMQRSSVATLMLCLFGLSTLHGAEDLPGLVKEKPSEGFSVQTEQGWMVAYEMAIPGTEVKFRMVPVSATTY